MKKEENRSSPFETLAAFLLLSIILFLLFEKAWLLYLGGSIGLIGLLIKQFTTILHTYWFFLIKYVGMVVNTVLLSTIFFLLLTPIAILYRLTNKRKLMSKSEKESYFITRNHEFESKDLSNTW